MLQARPPSSLRAVKRGEGEEGGQKGKSKKMSKSRGTPQSGWDAFSEWPSERIDCWGTGLAAVLFGAPELPRDLSSGVLHRLNPGLWSPRAAIELEEMSQ